MGISQWQDAEREELEVALKNCGERWAAEVKELQAELARLTERVRHHAEALNEVEAERDRLHEEERVWTEENDRLREELDAALKVAEWKSNELATLRAIIEERGIALTEANDENARLREALKDLRSYVDPHAVPYVILARADDALKETYHNTRKTLERENTRLREDFERLQRTAKVQHDEIARLREVEVTLDRVMANYAELWDAAVTVLNCPDGELGAAINALGNALKETT